MLNKHIVDLKWGQGGNFFPIPGDVYECRWGEMIYGLDDNKRGCSPSSCMDYVCE